MILAPVTARLAGIDAVIDDAVGLAEIATQAVVPDRAAYVIPDDEKGAEGASTTAFYEQLTEVGFAVVVAVSVAAARGVARDDIETLKEAVKERLTGWRHPASDRPAVYRGATMLRLDAVEIAMMLRFTIRTRFRTNLDWSS